MRRSSWTIWPRSSPPSTPPCAPIDRRASAPHPAKAAQASDPPRPVPPTYRAAWISSSPSLSAYHGHASVHCGFAHRAGRAPMTTSPIRRAATPCSPSTLLSTYHRYGILITRPAPTFTDVDAQTQRLVAALALVREGNRARRQPVCAPRRPVLTPGTMPVKGYALPRRTSPVASPCVSGPSELLHSDDGDTRSSPPTMSSPNSTHAGRAWQPRPRRPNRSLDLRVAADLPPPRPRPPRAPDASASTVIDASDHV